MKESQFQIKVVNWLRKHGYYVFSAPNGLHAADVINVRMNKLAGMTNGVADLIVLRPKNNKFIDRIIELIDELEDDKKLEIIDLMVKNNQARCVFLELKTETGTQRKEQVLFETIVKSMGFEYRIIKPSTDFKEVYEWLK